MSPSLGLGSLRGALRNPAERRLRAPVRIVLAVVVLAVTVVATTAVLSAFARPTRASLVSFAAITLGQAVPIPVVLAAGRLIDRRVLSDLGLGVDREWWIDFGFGSALGAALMTAVVAVAFAAGWIRVDDTFVVSGLNVGFAGAFATVTGFLLVAAVSEELLVRGYLLTNVAEGLAGYASERVAVGAAVVVSSSVFGLLHAGNPDASAVSVLSIGLAGVMLAVGYVVTDELALPIGVHLTWNLFQGPVYGFGVSGVDFGVALVGTTDVGPGLATGGVFGPEAGALGIGAELVGIAAVVGYGRWRAGSVGVAAGIARPDLRTGR